MKINTKTVHLGQETDPLTGAVNPPVYFTSTYHQKGIGQDLGYVYSRSAHPNRTNLEHALAGLENAKHGVCFASGCAAATALLNCLKPGDHVLATDDLYGGTHRLFAQVFAQWGLTFSFVKQQDTADQIKRQIKKNTRLIWVETPTNPLLRIFDISRFVSARGSHDAWIVVDNTFATPLLQQPLKWGADVVLHSTTKYISGHSDVIGGALLLNDKSLADRIHFYQKSAGAVPGIMDMYLTHRGMKTMSVRMRAHCENAEHVCEWLKSQPKVARVIYPEWEKSNGQMTAGGGMISFELKAPVSKLNTFFKRLKLIRLAESLGGVESLVCYPYEMTHGGMPEKQKAAIGLTKRLVRLSVGIEDWTDLRDDLNTALKGV